MPFSSPMVDAPVVIERVHGPEHFVTHVTHGIMKWLEMLLLFMSL